MGGAVCDRHPRGDAARPPLLGGEQNGAAHEERTHHHAAEQAAAEDMERVKVHNAAVDDMEELAANFNAEVREFKAKSAE